MKKFLIILAALMLCLTVVLCSCINGEQEDIDTDDIGDTTEESTPNDENSSESDTESDTESGPAVETIPESTEPAVTNPWGEGADGNGLEWTPNYDT